VWVFLGTCADLLRSEDGAAVDEGFRLMSCRGIINANQRSSDSGAAVERSGRLTTLSTPLKRRL